MEEAKWTGVSGKVYNIYKTIPTAECASTMLILHGLAEHGGLYGDLAKKLSERGIAVYVPDRIGHGKTCVEETDLVTYERMDVHSEQQDLGALIDYVKNSHPGKPFALFGHSAGSTLALFTALYQKLDPNVPVLLSGFPTLVPHALLKVMKHRYSGLLDDKHRARPAKIFNMCGVDSYGKKFKADEEFGWVTSYEPAREEYVADPKCGAPVKVEFALRFTEQMLYIQKHLEEAANLRICFLYGRNDPVCECGKGVADVVERLRKAGNTQVQTVAFDARHALHIEQPEVVEQVVAAVAAFLHLADE